MRVQQNTNILNIVGNGGMVAGGDSSDESLPQDYYFMNAHVNNQPQPHELQVYTQQFHNATKNFDINQEPTRQMDLNDHIILVGSNEVNQQANASYQQQSHEHYEYQTSSCKANVCNSQYCPRIIKTKLSQQRRAVKTESLLPGAINKRKYSCDVCQKRFTRPSTLPTHMNSHTGERPYCCNNVGYHNTI